MGYVNSKTKSLSQISEKSYVHSQTCSKMGQVRSKTRSVDQILEKPCVRSRGHIFSQIIVKLGQNICLDKILDEFENRLCQVKN